MGSKINRYIDIGCDNFQAAARNRKRIARKENIIGYQFIEAFVKAWPRGKPLPEYLMGRLPTIDKSERGNLNQYGIYEIGDDGLLKVDKKRNYNNE